ncbi:T9SS type A sorting domain-containing protein [candidate division TA06 bacterium]|nr:T9SS type A sorting domain-containing protein [candidate division TA06 bacterium]
MVGRALADVGRGRAGRRDDQGQPGRGHVPRGVAVPVREPQEQEDGGVGEHHVPLQRHRQREDGGFLAGLFLGHGNIDQLAHEKLFRNPVDIFALRNGPKNFFFYFGSCSVGQFDRPEKEDLASTLQKRRDGGGIATFAASRSSYASPNATLANRLFDNFFFNDTAKTIGKVITTTKIQLGNSQQNYNLFGDPASEWGPPELDVNLTLSPDSLIGLSQVTVQGAVSDPSFNGFASLTIFDSGDSTGKTFITPPPENDTFILKYTLPGTPIYKGVTRVLNGQFTQRFIVPDHSGGAMQLGDLGRVSVYVWDGMRDGHGALDSLFVGAGGTPEDTIPPKITILHGGRVLTGVDTLTVPLNPRITLLLEDESGIYLGDRRTDKRIHLVKDGDKDNRIFLNHLFQYEEGSYTRGRVEVDLQFSDPRDDTTHTLVFSASDNALNRSADTVVVKVIPSQRLALYRVMNYPNPVQNHRTRFIFELSEENVEVEIKVYTVAGRLIKILRVPGRVGFNSVEWDCRDEVGDAIANGVYLYKVVARTTSTGFTTSTEKVVEVVEKLIVAH